VTRVLLIFVLVSVLAWAFWRFVDGVIDAFGGTTRQRKARGRAAPMKLARDPVCGTWVPPGESLALSLGAETHYFCSAECRESFRKSA
jgi:YHS domain-containing protein